MHYLKLNPKNPLLDKNVTYFNYFAGNQLAGGRTTFAVGHFLDSKTDTISYVAANYLGTGTCVTLIDTPGTKDSKGNCKINLQMKSKCFPTIRGRGKLKKGRDTLIQCYYHPSVILKQLWTFQFRSRLQTFTRNAKAPQNRNKIFRRYFTSFQWGKSKVKVIKIIKSINFIVLNIISNFYLRTYFEV